MSTSPPAPTSTTEPPDPSAGRGNRFGDGLKSIFKALWFLVSLIIYVIGSILYQAGRALIMISGWGSGQADGESPKPPAPTANL